MIQFSLQEFSMSDRVTEIKKIILCSILIALVIVGSYLSLPIGPVPIVLQNFFILLLALILPWRLTAISIAAYLVMGLVGMPVFAGGAGGYVHFTSPSAGYLLGYFPAAVLASLIANSGKAHPVKDMASALVFLTIVYVLGVSWLMIKLHFPLAKGLAAGFTPFILIDAIKAVLAIAMIQFIRKPVQEMTQAS